MPVIVRALGETAAFEVSQGESVQSLQARIASHFGLELSLTVAGRPLTELGVQDGVEIAAFAPVDGAGKDKKRKKKQHKTPKKIKHQHKKLKLVCIKQYTVNGDEVSSIRQYCEKCGPGVRMAQHKNRLHCGRCGFAKIF